MEETLKVPNSIVSSNQDSERFQYGTLHGESLITLREPQIKNNHTIGDMQL